MDTDGTEELKERRRTLKPFIVGAVSAGVAFVLAGCDQASDPASQNVQTPAVNTASQQENQPSPAGGQPELVRDDWGGFQPADTPPRPRTFHQSDTGDDALVQHGRLLDARIRMRGKTAIFSPGHGLPVLNAKGEVNPDLVAYLDRLGFSTHDAQRSQARLEDFQQRSAERFGTPVRDDPAVGSLTVGVKEIELTVEQNVPPDVAKTFCQRLQKLRGITVIPKQS